MRSIDRSEDKNMMMRILLKGGLSLAEKKREREKIEKAMEEVRENEKARFGETFEEWFSRHRSCLNCQGNQAIAVYEFWSEKGGAK